MLIYQEIKNKTLFTTKLTIKTTHASPPLTEKTLAKTLNHADQRCVFSTIKRSMEAASKEDLMKKGHEMVYLSVRQAKKMRTSNRICAKSTKEK